MNSSSYPLNPDLQIIDHKLLGARFKKAILSDKIIYAFKRGINLGVLEFVDCTFNTRDKFPFWELRTHPALYTIVVTSKEVKNHYQVLNFLYRVGSSKRIQYIKASSPKAEFSTTDLAHGLAGMAGHIVMWHQAGNLFHDGKTKSDCSDITAILERAPNLLQLIFDKSDWMQEALFQPIVECLERVTTRNAVAARENWRRIKDGEVDNDLAIELMKRFPATLHMAAEDLGDRWQALAKFQEFERKLGLSSPLGMEDYAQMQPVGLGRVNALQPIALTGIKVPTIGLGLVNTGGVLASPSNPNARLRELVTGLPELTEDGVREKIRVGWDNPSKMMEVGGELDAARIAIAGVTLNAVVSQQGLGAFQSSLAGFLRTVAEIQDIVADPTGHYVSLRLGKISLRIPLPGARLRQQAVTLENLARAGELVREASQQLSELITATSGMAGQIKLSMERAQLGHGAHRGLMAQYTMVRNVANEELAKPPAPVLEMQANGMDFEELPPVETARDLLGGRIYIMNQLIVATGRGALIHGEQSKTLAAQMAGVNHFNTKQIPELLGAMARLGEVVMTMSNSAVLSSWNVAVDEVNRSALKAQASVAEITGLVTEAGGQLTKILSEPLEEAEKPEIKPKGTRRYFGLAQ